MKKIVVSLITITLLFLAGCADKKPLSENDKIYAGKWIANDGTWLHIFNDGGGSFEKSNSSVTGGAAEISDSTIKIGLFGISSTYHIDKAPFEEDGHWKMHLDGNIYVKQ